MPAIPRRVFLPPRSPSAAAALAPPRLRSNVPPFRRLSKGAHGHLILSRPTDEPCLRLAEMYPAKWSVLGRIKGLARGSYWWLFWMGSVGVTNLAVQTEQAVRQVVDNPWTERLARLGYAVQGLLYGAIGLLSVQAALGVRRAPED